MVTLLANEGDGLATVLGARVLDPRGPVGTLRGPLDFEIEGVEVRLR
jgi:hypothetical protein